MCAEPNADVVLVSRLYPTCPWDVKSARRLIVDRKIAPRFPGKDAKESCFTQECPICFMVQLPASIVVGVRSLRVCSSIQAI